VQQCTGATRQVRGAIAEIQQQVADLLCGPWAVRVRGHAEDMHIPGADLDHEEAVQALQGHRAVHVEEVGRPSRSRTWSWRISSPSAALRRGAWHRRRECQARSACMSEHPGGGCAGGGARGTTYLSGPVGRLIMGSFGCRRQPLPGDAGQLLRCRGLAPSRIGRRCAHRVRAGASGRSGRDTVHSPAPDDCPAPRSQPPGRGHDTGAAVTCAFTAMARI
jgi:hypothetical protein